MVGQGEKGKTAQARAKLVSDFRTQMQNKGLKDAKLESRVQGYSGMLSRMETGARDKIEKKAQEKLKKDFEKKASKDAGRGSGKLGWSAGKAMAKAGMAPAPGQRMSIMGRLGSASASEGTKGFLKGGQFSTAGMGLAFVLPALAGMFASTKSRQDRAGFNTGTGRFEVTEGAGMDMAQPIAMGAGMGAMFGLPGLLIGGGLGIVKALDKTALSLNEVAALHDKEVQNFAASLQAGQGLVSLIPQLGDAKISGTESEQIRLSTQMQQIIAGVADPKHRAMFAKSSMTGNKRSMEENLKEISDDMIASSATQSFLTQVSKASADSGRLASGAFSTFLSARLQGRSEEDKNEARAILERGREDSKRMPQPGEKGYMSPADIMSMRKRAGGEGMENITSGQGIGWGVGGGIAGGILSLFTAGVGAPWLVPIGAAIGNAIGSWSSKSDAQGQIADLEARGMGGATMKRSIFEMQQMGILDTEEAAMYQKGISEGVLSPKEFYSIVLEDMDAREDIANGAKLHASKIFNLTKMYADLMLELDAGVKGMAVANKHMLEMANTSARFSAKWENGRPRISGERINFWNNSGKGWFSVGRESSA